MSVGDNPSNSPSPLAVHLHDQIDAACEETVRLQLDFVREKPGRTLMSVGDFDSFLAAPTPEACVCRRMMRAIESGEVLACGHLANPQPVTVLAWDKVVTLRCAHCTAHIQRLVGDDDYRCDHCGTVDHDQIVSSTSKGPLMMYYGLCTVCHQASR